MAEVTWKATFIGAFILFLIGVIVATCLNYAEAAILSIEAGISGPFPCVYDPKVKDSWIQKNISCGKPDGIQECVYVRVSYTDKETQKVTKNIKLSLSFKYNKNETITSHHTVVNEDGTRTLLRKCSADYCGNYKFKRVVDNHREYIKHPFLIEAVRFAEVNESGKIECYLNREKPEDGAFLKLNDLVKKPEDRMFRWYEGWLILISPLIITLAIITFVVVLFLKGRLAASAVQKAKETFVPPGFAQMTAEPQETSNASSLAVTRSRTPSFV